MWSAVLSLFLLSHLFVVYVLVYVRYVIVFHVFDIDVYLYFFFSVLLNIS